MLGEALVDVLGPIESVRYPLEIDCCDFPYRSNTIGYFVINSKINQFDQQRVVSVYCNYYYCWSRQAYTMQKGGEKHILGCYMST
jgi:hypothetical protein